MNKVAVVLVIGGVLIAGGLWLYMREPAPAPTLGNKGKKQAGVFSLGKKQNFNIGGKSGINASVNPPSINLGNLLSGIFGETESNGTTTTAPSQTNTTTSASRTDTTST